MNCSGNNCYNPFFSHIYVESEAMAYPITSKIITEIPNTTIVEVKHYKDIFCRGRQDFQMQKNTPSLILAVKHSNLVYEGAPVCQSFGNQHFYYTSVVMNCIYDCEYCYLQGMYPSANIVIFVNYEDIFLEIERLLILHPVYLCISYDTDLLAIDGLLDIAGRWFQFAKEHPDLTIELRTKAANLTFLEKQSAVRNVILAWTLSPQGIITSYEHRTPSLGQRLACIRKALEKGFPIRLCFDPMLYCSDWRNQYEELINTVFSAIPAEHIFDTSIGTFRISGEYMKQIRKQRPDSSLIQYPYENYNGIYCYRRELSHEMISFVYQLISEKMPENRIFVWEDTL